MQPIQASGVLQGTQQTGPLFKAGPLPDPPGLGGASQTTSFKEMLLDSVQQVNTMQQDASRAVEGLMTGGDVNPAEVLTAVQKADLAFRMVMQVRNKMLAAFNEVKDLRI